MKVLETALVICPNWDINFPPYGISLLAGILNSTNLVNAQCFDFNKDLFNNTGKNHPMWDDVSLYPYWLDQKNVDKVFNEHPQFIEECIQKLIPFKFIGFSCFSLNLLFTIKLASIIKQRFPEKILLAGGPECNPSFSDLIYRAKVFDAICTGEAEDSLPSLIANYAKTNCLEAKGFQTLSPDGEYRNPGECRTMTKLDDLAFADFSYLGHTAKTFNTSTSRGCVRDCSYCPEKAIWGNYRWRSANSTVQELLQLRSNFKDIDFVYFNDDLVNGNMRELERMCDLLIENNWNVGWGGHALVRDRWTDTLLEKIKKTNGQRFNFGIESGSNRILGLMKKMFKIEQAYDLFERMHYHQISFSINLIICGAGETQEDFEATRMLAKTAKKYTDYIHINPCIVLKGTDLYRNPDKWDITFGENFVTEWESLDKTNTLEIRLKKARQLIEEIG